MRGAWTTDVNGVSSYIRYGIETRTEKRIARACERAGWHVDWLKFTYEPEFASTTRFGDGQWWTVSVRSEGDRAHFGGASADELIARILPPVTRRIRQEATV